MKVKYVLNPFTGNFDAVARSASGITKTFDCPASVAVDDWVYKTTTANEVDKADASANATGYSIGVVISKPTTTRAEVLMMGEIGGQSGLSVGGLVYLSETAGEYTQTRVTTSGATSQILGRALSATEICVKIEIPIRID